MTSKGEPRESEFLECGIFRLDKLNRLDLGELVKGARQVRVFANAQGHILVKPIYHIPAEELWVSRNRQALLSIQKGIRDAEEQRMSPYFTDGSSSEPRDEVKITDYARNQLVRLKTDYSLSLRYHAIHETIQRLALNNRRDELKTRQLHSLRGPQGQALHETYAEDCDPPPFPIFWYQTPQSDEIIILSITLHE